MSNQENFLGQAPMTMGLVGHLENTLAQKAAPQASFRFGHRLGGWSGLTLPGSMQNIRGFRRSKPEKLDKPRNLIGHPNDRNGGSYW